MRRSLPYSFMGLLGEKSFGTCFRRIPKPQRFDTEDAGATGVPKHNFRKPFIVVVCYESCWSGTSRQTAFTVLRVCTFNAKRYIFHRRLWSIHSKINARVTKSNFWTMCDFLMKLFKFFVKKKKYNFNSNINCRLI